MATPITRRDRQRESTVAEIKAAAWADMSRSGTVDVSLRGVAREMGMAVSALYRYFPSREDLITALIVDSFDGLTARLRRAFDSAPADLAPADLFVRVGATYRQWAMEDPLQYRLAFGSPIGGYTGSDETTASSRSSGVLLEIMARAVDTGRVDDERMELLLTPDLRVALDRWSAQLPRPLPTAALGAALISYAALHGAINLELNRHLPPTVRSNADLFEASLRQSIHGLLH